MKKFLFDLSRSRFRSKTLPVPSPFRSLRFRLLGPLIGVALVAAVIVALASYRLGDRWAMDDLQERFAGIKNTLADSTFPLNATVLNSLAELTQTDLVTTDDKGRVKYSTIDGIESPLQSDTLRTADKRYLVYYFDTRRGKSRSDDVSRVAVVFDERTLSASRRRAAILPLATGLSTIVALSSITLLMQSRLVGRIAKLQRRVGGIAAGEFSVAPTNYAADELGQLGAAVDDMAGQLDQLWKRVNRQQSEKLLHQIAGGMAHQLRNSLTGARMAVELHAAECPSDDRESLPVAIQQIELSEDYVRRLLLVASGRQDEDRPTEVSVCWNDVRSSLSPIARHWHVELDWVFNDSLGTNPSESSSQPEPAKWIGDGPTWVAAVTNLVHNAMQAGDKVEVRLDFPLPDLVRVRVCDNGTGIDESVGGELFEPFVTSKPEGMGLGLSVVRRAAERLEGAVRWYRDDGRTVFEFTSRLSQPN
ncbi:membrane protein containing ATP-binding region, ATPase-like domain protein [Rhodopirellula sallentina SM41]|uniref:histidine kinase n=1 Tax=Rhodopirellula sallentina SM41 TaxID=1263870 RepID=M5U2M5_9BACT|nr:membrane protein containing ATP-binding region, ATPase-like domain protein [Rhodopirellula sallentina SM41]